MLAFRRRGRGVSYHDFELAIAPVGELRIRSSLQGERRRRHIGRRMAHQASLAGRYQRFLARVQPGLPRAFLEPFLYFTIEKP